MTPSCSSISYFPSAQTRNSRNGPTATFPEDSIPAHAGKTPGMDTTSHCVSAHPRSRGENSGLRLWLSARSGSSPLTRGKRGGGRLARWGGRLIPAHAGKTYTPASPPTTSRAHPRSRGENTLADGRITLWAGSSPLTRGKHIAQRDTPCRVGLIPAHAGKTIEAFVSVPASRAHPRSRGENPTGSVGGLPSRGSSPLTRGKPRIGPL